MEPQLTNARLAWTWVHFAAVVVFIGVPLFGDTTGAVVGFLGFLFGMAALLVAQIHAGLWDDVIADFR